MRSRHSGPVGYPGNSMINVGFSPVLPRPSEPGSGPGRRRIKKPPEKWALSSNRNMRYRESSRIGKWRGIMADEKIVTVALSKLAAELADKHEMPKKTMNTLLGDFIDMTV